MITSFYTIYLDHHPVHINHLVHLSKSLISRNFTPKLIDYFPISFWVLHPSYPCHSWHKRYPMCNVCYTGQQLYRRVCAGSERDIWEACLNWPLGILTRSQRRIETLNFRGTFAFFASPWNMTVQYARQIFMYSWDCARRRDSKRSGQVQKTVESVPFIFSFFSSLSFSREILEDPSLIVSLRFRRIFATKSQKLSFKFKIYKVRYSWWNNLIPIYTISQNCENEKKSKSREERRGLNLVVSFFFI